MLNNLPRPLSVSDRASLLLLSSFSSDAAIEVIGSVSVGLGSTDGGGRI